MPIMPRLVLALFLAAFSALCAAADWPSQTIRFIVPAPAGSSVDGVARLIAERLSKVLGQSIIVDNRGGAGGTIGTDAVVRARDGHTFLVAYNGPLTVAPSLFAKLPYQSARDLAPIILAVTQPNVLAVRSDLKVDTLAELVALARSRPGKIDYGSVGNGSLSHLAMEMLKIRSATFMLHIPYNGGPAASLALARGEIPLLFAALSNVQPLLASGRIKLLAVSNGQRSAALPELPTIAEQGFPGFDATTWNGFLGPADTPVEVVKRMNKAIGQILASPEVHQKLLAVGAETAGGTPEQFAALLKRETAAWAAVIERSKIRPD